MVQSNRLGRCTLAVAGLVAIGGLASAQTFQNNTTQIPQGNPNNNSNSENIDFGDVDLDGDFDAVFADGGDCCNDQNRIWINQGGLQAGTVGFFSDETSTRFPVISDDSRDIEFVDFDGDGDLDIYVSDTSQISNQSNRWWTNMGNLQAGTKGFFVDQTAARWIGLNSANSSIAASQLLGSGGFIDFSCDCDFGDLDNDGDIDLVHSSYGGAFGGNTPTRIFLNDAAGNFVEHNPSGFKLTGQNILAGNPALWAEGTHASNTTNSTGVNADIASSALDIDVGDVDGDYDFDILHGARQEAPRFFKSRLAETGNLIWRDVTGAVYPAGYTSGNGHYEQEFGDFDNDDDLDIYGLNWFNNFTDETLVNNGTGVFGSLATLAGSASDDNEGDFGDYDNDGDLDLYVANFSGQDRLYRNELIPSSTFSYTNVTASELPSFNRIALDADWDDVDNDCDYDIFVANDAGQANIFLKNLSQIPDTHAPRVVHLEQAPNRVSGINPTVVRVYVYDNAAYYVTWYNTTVLEYSVNGGPFYTVPMQSSQGQIFRGEVPGAMIGNVQYRVRSTDRCGNVGLSNTLSFVATDGGCNGSTSTYCTAKASSIPSCIPAVTFNGTPSASAGSGFLVQAGPTPGNNFGLFLYTINGQMTPANTAFGFLCISTSGMKRIGAQNGGGNLGVCNGNFKFDFNAFAASGVDPALVAGESVDTQVWYRDAPNPGGANFTNAGAFIYCP